MHPLRKVAINIERMECMDDGQAELKLKDEGEGWRERKDGERGRMERVEAKRSRRRKGQGQFKKVRGQDEKSIR